MFRIGLLVILLETCRRSPYVLSTVDVLCESIEYDIVFSRHFYLNSKHSKNLLKKVSNRDSPSIFRLRNLFGIFAFY